MREQTTKEFRKFLKKHDLPMDTSRDMFLSFPLESDNFKDAYEMLENGAEMWARLYCLDQFTVWNHVAKEIEVVRRKIMKGFIDKPTTIPYITSTKTGGRRYTLTIKDY